MKIFKTICHNNIHRDYTDEIVTIDPNSPYANMLWRDNRPRFKGELRLIFSENGFDFQIEDLVIGKEYTLKIDEPIVSIQAGVISVVGTADPSPPSFEDGEYNSFVNHMLFTDDRPEGLS